jgi:Flp pilus assembly protein TadG
MIDTLRKLFRKEEGTVIVLVALGLTVFLGFTSLVTDIGLLLVERGKLVQAVDAAALAGVQELPDNPTAATTKAAEYAQKNGVSSPTVTISADNKEITVESTKQVNLAFAKIWGLNQSNVKAAAKAVVAPVKSVTGAIPMSILEQPLVAGQKYIIKSANGIGGYGSGWRGILDFTGGGGGAAEYRTMTKNGYPGQLAIGQVIDKETGNKSGPTEDGVNDRIAACTRIPPCSAADYEPDCPRLVWVPVIEEVDNKTVRVVGFAAFFLEEVEGSGNKNNVWATLVKQTMSAEIDTGGTDYGLYGVKLIN